MAIIFAPLKNPVSGEICRDDRGKVSGFFIDMDIVDINLFTDRIGYKHNKKDKIKFMLDVIVDWHNFQFKGEEVVNKKQLKKALGIFQEFAYMLISDAIFEYHAKDAALMFCKKGGLK